MVLTLKLNKVNSINNYVITLKISRDNSQRFASYIEIFISYIVCILQTGISGILNPAKIYLNSLVE